MVSTLLKFSSPLLVWSSPKSILLKLLFIGAASKTFPLNFKWITYICSAWCNPEKLQSLLICVIMFASVTNMVII